MISLSRSTLIAAALLALFGSAFSTTAAAASLFDHVLYLTIDGLRQADLDDPNLAQDLPNITALRNAGITYTNTFTPVPTDSFPGLLAEFTGASPRTTGIYYDHAYSRSLYAPFATTASAPGTQLDSTGSIDWNNTLLGGGDSTGTTDGAFGAGSINPSLLQQRNVGGTLVPVLPHGLLKVNTVFEIAHAAGLRTAYIDKRPGYEILNGPSGSGLDDFYAAEVDARVKIDGSGAAAHLVDANTTTTGTGGLAKITSSTLLSNAYDDLRMTALLNEIDGKTSIGGMVPGNAVPAIFGMNFVTLGITEKLASGGIDPTNGPSANFHLALSHADADIGRIVSELQAQGLFNNTLIVLTAKHGSNPRLGSATRLGSSTFTGALAGQGIAVAGVQEDDSVLLWLQDPSQTAQAKTTLQGITGVDTVYGGTADLVGAGFGDPSTDDRTPDLIVKLQPGFIVSDSSKIAEHGGFADDDTHIALVLSSGGLAAAVQGTMQIGNVSTTQIAVTALDALGLDANQLQGAAAENTLPLPGTGIAAPEPSAGIIIALGLIAMVSRSRRLRILP
jgi:hypothetical protein